MKRCRRTGHERRAFGVRIARRTCRILRAALAQRDSRTVGIVVYCIAFGGERLVFGRGVEGLRGIVVFHACSHHVQLALAALNRCAVKISSAGGTFGVARRSVVMRRDGGLRRRERWRWFLRAFIGDRSTCKTAPLAGPHHEQQQADHDDGPDKPADRPVHRRRRRTRR